MKYREVPFDRLKVSKDLARTAGSKVFEEHLTASIREIGLSEPLKVALSKDRSYVVIDGVMRLHAIEKIRRDESTRFARVPVYVVPFDERYEIRFQTDIYQDLLPSQLASLVEHLHETAQINKKEIARFIGVSSATLRNYTGLWRLVQRGGLFKQIVDLMDHGVLPASNPYAWLRLTAKGLRRAIESSFSGGTRAEIWIHEQLLLAAEDQASTFPLKFIEAATDALPPDCYRQGENARALKRNLGLRRAAAVGKKRLPPVGEATTHLTRVLRGTHDPVLRTAAMSLRNFLK